MDAGECFRFRRGMAPGAGADIDDARDDDVGNDPDVVVDALSDRRAAGYPQSEDGTGEDVETASSLAESEDPLMSPDGDAYEAMLAQSMRENDGYNDGFSVQMLGTYADRFVRSFRGNQSPASPGVERPTTTAFGTLGRGSATTSADGDRVQDKLVEVARAMLNESDHGTSGADPEDLDTDVGIGLRLREVASRRERYGENTLMAGVDDGDTNLMSDRFGKALRKEIRNPMIRVALVAIGLELAQSFNFSERDDPVFNAIILAGLIVGNAYVSYLERVDAVRASYELTRMVSARATVIRAGRTVVVDATELVPGDVVILSPGSGVPADCVSSGPQTLVLDNSLITGERQTVDVAAGEPLFMRGVVKRGTARALVVRTGKNTFAGRAARLVRKREAVRRELSAFDVNLTHVMYGLSLAGCVCSLSVLLYLLVSGRDFFGSLSFCVILLIASTPLAIRTVVATTSALGVRALSKRGAIVTRMSVIEDLASMNVVCVDKTGVLTRDATRLNSSLPTIPLLEGVGENDVMTAAALSTKWNEPAANAIDSMILKAFDTSPLSAYEMVEYKPFSAAHRRFSESLIRRSDGSMFRVMKGPIDTVLDACSNGEEVQTIVKDAMANLQSQSARGVISRALAVACSKNVDDPFVALGLIIYEDVRRADANEMIHTVSSLGIDVKIITGDSSDVAALACQKVGFDFDDINSPSDVPYVPLRTSVLNPQAAESIKRMRVFADMLPEDKLALVKAYRCGGDVVGLVSDAAGDAAALHLADVGVAMNTASDAAKSASDVVLTVPSLAILAHAVLSARIMFARVRDYILFRATCTTHLLGFFTLGALTVAPNSFDAGWPDMFTLPVIALCVVLALNDLVVIGSAYDHAAPSRLPEKWRLLPDAVVSVVSGLVACFTSLALLGITLSTTKADTYFAQDVKGRALAYGEVQTCLFLKIVLTDALTVFSARTHNSFLERRPGGLVVTAFLTSLVLSCMLAANWPFMALESISWAHILFVFVFSLGSFALQDAVKVTTYRVLLRAEFIENVGTVSSAEFARVSKAVDRVTPKQKLLKRETSLSSPERVSTPPDGDYDVEEARQPLLDESDDNAEEESTSFGEDERRSVITASDEDVDEFYSDYGGGTESEISAAAGAIDPSPEIIAEMLNREADTPKYERLRRTPGYCMATLTDVQAITETHDWWVTFQSLQKEAIKEHVYDVSSVKSFDNDDDDNDDDNRSLASARTGQGRKVIPYDALTALEMGCGVGTFSAALCRHLSDATTEALRSPLADPAMRRLYVSLDLLDVSAVALHAASLSLQAPFHVGTLHHGTLTSFVPPRDAAMLASSAANSSDGESVMDAGGGTDGIGYDIVYSVHGFATCPRSKIHLALRNFRASLRPGGLGFIAAATEQSHDAKFSLMYHAERRKRLGAPQGEIPRMTSAEDICDALSAQGVSYNVEVKSHETIVDVADGLESLESYLHGVVMDDSLSLDTMMTSNSLGAYLSSCMSSDGSSYTFPQRVAHVTL